MASLLGAAMMTGSFGIWMRWVSPMLSPAAQSIARFALAALLLLGSIIWLRYTKHSSFLRLRLTRRQIVLVVLLGIGTGGIGILYSIAVQFTKVAGAMSLMSAGGIMVAALVGTMLLKERLTPGKLLAISVAMTGLFLYAGGLHLSIGLLLGLGAGACDGFCNCIRKLLRGTDALSVIMYQYIGAAIVLLPFLLVAHHPAIKTVSLWPLLALVCFTLLSVSLGSLLLLGFSRLDANVGAVILASQIFFAMLLSALLLREYPSWHELFGGILIFSASILAVADIKTWRFRFWSRRPAPAELYQ